MQLPWRPLSTQTGTARPRRGLPSATVCLLAVSLAGFAARLAVRRWSGDAAEGTLQDWGGLSVDGLSEGRLWQPLTHVFLPGGAAWPWLLLVDLPVLLLAGRHLERIVGRRHVVALYGLAGAVGGLSQVGFGWLLGVADGPVTGAEAPVLAVFVALACAVPEMELVPPLALAAGAGGSAGWLRIRHGARAAMFAAAAMTGAAAVLSLRGREPWAAGLPAARCLAAGAVACVYMGRLGFGRRSARRACEQEVLAAAWAAAERRRSAEEPVFAAPLAAASGKLVVPRFTERERRMSPQQYISERIDPILDKISLHGLGSLTEEERRTLENAREKIARHR